LHRKSSDNLVSPKLLGFKLTVAEVFAQPR
jgi:hypothetical protein